jgi:hypothetical protein
MISCRTRYCPGATCIGSVTEIGEPFTVCRVYEISCGAAGEKKRSIRTDVLLVPRVRVLLADLVDFEPLGG